METLLCSLATIAELLQSVRGFLTRKSKNTTLMITYLIHVLSKQRLLDFKRFDRQFGVTRRRKKLRSTLRKQRAKYSILMRHGVFLKEMKDHGWEAYGVEPSNYASEIALNQLDLNVYNCYLDDVNFDDNYFDIVTLWDVFEHLPDPVRTMRIIRRILKPDGFIVITTPNTESWERKIFKQYWAGWDVPRHYNIFSDKAIDRLLKDQGMQLTI